MKSEGEGYGKRARRITPYVKQDFHASGGDRLETDEVEFCMRPGFGIGSSVAANEQGGDTRNRE